MEFLPIFQRVRGTRCVLVGGGEIAARKFALLERAGASVVIVSPLLADTLRDACAAGRFEHSAMHFEPEHLDGATLAIAATGVRAVNERVARAAADRRIPVNVVDDPELCTFVMPAIVDRSPLIVAISSAGHAPVIARRVRERIEALLPAGFGRFVRWAGGLRDAVTARLEPAFRRSFWERLSDSAALEHILAGDEHGARRIAEQVLESGEGPGHVWLVGAGPGDPDLLTLKALRVLQQADVIVHDRLVAPAILELARRDAERIDVGKSMNRHLLPQNDINALLIRLAIEGRKVVRLKGGDPYVFGRGGEEGEALSAAGMGFTVVPGISAMSGIAASCGIPLTHRSHADNLRVLTGHSCKGKGLDYDWTSLATPGQTLVFYMGLSNVSGICSRLVAAGAEERLPAALVVDGTRPTERVIEGTLASLPALVRAADVRGPALIVIGEVVALRERLAMRSGVMSPASTAIRSYA